MDMKFVVITETKKKKKRCIETDTECLVDMRSISEDSTDSILKLRDFLQKKGKELVLCFVYPQNKIRGLNISYSKWCKDNNIKYSTLAKMSSKIFEEQELKEE